CEAAVGGGLITDAELTADGPFVSTTEGLFQQAKSSCSYDSVELGAGDGWPLSFSGTGLEPDARQVALVLDRPNDEVLVLRRHTTGFEVLTRFPRDAGFREVVARGDWSFVTGYTFSPRTFRVAVSGPSPTVADVGAASEQADADAGA